jgi:hypothetical protein
MPHMPHIHWVERQNKLEIQLFRVAVKSGIIYFATSKDIRVMLTLGTFLKRVFKGLV